jgi:hypothetical protein
MSVAFAAAESANFAKLTVGKSALLAPYGLRFIRRCRGAGMLQIEQTRKKIMNREAIWCAWNKLPFLPSTGFAKVKLRLFPINDLRKMKRCRALIALLT